MQLHSFGESEMRLIEDVALENGVWQHDTRAAGSRITVSTRGTIMVSCVCLNVMEDGGELVFIAQ